MHARMAIWAGPLDKLAQPQQSILANKNLLAMPPPVPSISTPKQETKRNKLSPSTAETNMAQSATSSTTTDARLANPQGGVRPEQ